VAQVLLEQGWADVHALYGGLDAWQRAGYPVEPK
jgi:rhodanese-related sulfurtransferase